MSDSGEDGTDLVRQALQVHINEAGSDVDNGEWLVTHYVAVVGLFRAADGAVKTRPLLVSPTGQPRWMTNGLLGEAPDLLAQLVALDEEEESEAEDGE